MRAKSRARSQSNRRDDGVTNETARTKAERAQKLSQRKMNRMARQGEADRHVAAAMPKHLVCSPFILWLATSLTNYSSLAREAWGRRTVVSVCISQITMVVSWLWRLGVQVKSKRDMKLFILKHVWSGTLRLRAREGLHHAVDFQNQKNLKTSIEEQTQASFFSRSLTLWSRLHSHMYTVPMAARKCA